MKKVLIHGTAQQTLVWDVSSTAERDQALLELFGRLDRLGTYSSIPAEQFQFWHMAKRGNARYAEALLLFRRGEPGEAYEEVQVGLRDTLPPLQGVSPIPDASASETT